MESYLPPKCGYTVEGRHIVADGSIIGKVTGTAMGGILGVSPWSTPFQVACQLLGLATKDLSDKPAIKTGIALEGKVIRYAGEKYPEYGMFLSAEDAGFKERTGDHSAWVSDFEDEVFGGHVDGIVLGEGDEQSILEIKTSSNLDSWVNGVPVYYQLQVMLYNHFLTHKDKAYVVLGEVNENTYRDPQSWVPNTENVRLFILDIDREEFGKTLDRVREWYNTYVARGITPDYDPTNPGDVELYQHLTDLSTDIDEFKTLVGELGKIHDEIEEYDAVIDLKRAEEASLKARLKEYLSAHQLSKLEDGGFRASLSTRNSTSLNEAQMLADGIDLQKYEVRKSVKSFTIKKIKE